MHVRLSKTFGFESAHWLPCFPPEHPCRRMHGHSFRAEVVIEGSFDPKQGYLIDLNDLTAATLPLEQALDHRCLNEVPGLDNPTSEMIAKWIWDQLKPVMPLLTEVIVQETCTSRCSYRGT